MSEQQADQDIHMAQAAPYMAHECVADNKQPVGDTAFIHKLGQQHEQRDCKQ